jgi:SAM-dependent methyltransferase
MEPEIKIACVVCGGAEFVRICSAEEIAVQQRYLCCFHQRRLRPEAPRQALEERAEFTQDYATNIVACTDCGLVLRNPRPPRDEIERAYQQDDYSAERLEAMFASQCEQFRLKAYRLDSSLRPGARVVEVGSFLGGFLAAGRERQWDIQGVDPGEEVVEFCRKRGFAVFRGTLQEAPIAPGSLDCVAVWNTFDQIPDPHPLLAAARATLSPGGLLVVRVPNGSCFQWSVAQTRRYRHTVLRPVAQLLLRAMAWNNLLAFPYLYGYSVPTLDRLMAGYDLKRSAVAADTLVRLSDEDTRFWAAWEERAIKRLCRVVARLDSLRWASEYRLAPWLDVYYRASPS